MDLPQDSSDEYPTPNFAALAEDALAAWCSDQPQVVAFDTETSGVAFHDEAFCVTFAWRNSEGKLSSHYIELDTEGRRNIARSILRSRYLVGHNLKFDIQKSLLAGLLDRDELVPERLHDTEALAHLDDEHREKGLKKLAITVLNEEDVVEVQITAGPNKGQTRLVPREQHEMNKVRRKIKRKVNEGYKVLPRAVVLPYAIKDAELTYRLYETLRPRVERYDDLWSLYKQEMALSLVFLDMEREGMRIDEPYVQEMIREYQKRVLKTELAIELVVGRPVGKEKDQFNPASNPQLAEYFQSVGEAREKYDEANLREIDHPLAHLLVEYRSDSKLLTTYFRALKEESRDGIYHPSIRQHGTVTGRVSAGKVVN